MLLKYILSKSVSIRIKSEKKWPESKFWSFFLSSHYLVAASTGIEPVFSPWEGDVLTPWPTGHLFVCRLLFAVDSFNIHHLFLKCKYFFKKISIFLFFSNFSFKKPCIYAAFATKKVFIFCSREEMPWQLHRIPWHFPVIYFCFWLFLIPLYPPQALLEWIRGISFLRVYEVLLSQLPQYRIPSES